MALFEKVMIRHQFAGRRDDESHEEYRSRTLHHGRPADISWVRYFLLGDYEPTGFSMSIWGSLRIIPRLIVLRYGIFSATFHQTFSGLDHWKSFLFPLCGLLFLPMTTLTYAVWVPHDGPLLGNSGLPFLAAALLADICANYYSWQLEWIVLNAMVFIQLWVSRIALVGLLIFKGWISQAFPDSMGFLALLGFLVLPTATLVYTFNKTHPGIVHENGWIFLTAGILTDIIVQAKLVRPKSAGEPEGAPSKQAGGAEIAGNSNK